MTDLKEMALSFLRLVASGNVGEAFQSFVSSDFRHHNPYFKGDADSLMHAMEENAAKNPHKVLTVMQAIAEGDRVMVYSHVKQNSEDLGMAVVHLFRFQDDRIVELWDVGQGVPADSPNGNGMF